MPPNRPTAPRPVEEHSAPPRPAGPADIHNDLRNSEDSTLLGAPNPRFHYALARACLRSRRFGELWQLIQAVSSWPRWANGDWNVAYAELLRSSGQVQEAVSAIDTMPSQPPPMLTKALCALTQGDALRTEELAKLVATDKDADGFYHPEGRPDALAHALLAFVALGRLDLNEAEQQAREAVRLDPSCALARDVWAQSLSQLSLQAEALEVLDDGLRRRPGEPRLVEAAIRVALETGDLPQAEKILQSNRSLLDEYGAEATGSSLGELVALARLEALGLDENEPVEVDWPWVRQLDIQEQNWIAAARLCAERPETRGGCVLYFAKVAEKALFERLFEPFLKGVELQIAADSAFDDIARFVQGGRPPALGGMVRLLSAAMGPYRSVERPVVTALRSYLRSAPAPLDRQLLLGRELVHSLGRLARARNDAAHLDDPTQAEQETAFGLMVDTNGPGIFLRAVGISGAS